MSSSRLQRAMRGLRGDSGQSLIEFAFAVPLLLLIILALIDFGRGISAWLDATHVANEGARLAAVNATPPSGTLASYIQQQTFGELRTGSAGADGVQGAAKVCISFPGPNSGSGGTPRRGDPVTVTVSANYQWAPGGFIPGSFPLTGSATMRLEQDPTFGAQCSS